MSSLYSRGRSIWIKFRDADGRLQQRPTGYRKSAAGKVPQGALELKTRIDNEIILGRWGFELPGDDSMRITEALDEFLETKGGTFSPSYVKLIRLSVRKLTDFLGDIAISKVSPGELFKWRNEMLDKDGEQNAACWIRHVSPLFSWAASPISTGRSAGIIQRSPFVKGVRLNPDPPPQRIFSPSELRRVSAKLKADSLHKFNQLEFLRLFGCRLSDTFAITWDQIDFERRVVRYYNHKGKRWDEFPMYRELHDFLRTVPRDFVPFVFKYRTRKVLYETLKGIIKDLGIDSSLTIHTLKGNFVEEMFRRLSDLSDVQRAARHQSIQTTIRHYKYHDVRRLGRELDKRPRARKPKRK